MTRSVKVKGHTRSDGTKVRGYQRKRSKLSDAKASRSRAKGQLRKARRTGAGKEDMSALKKMARNVRRFVGKMRKSRKSRR